MISNVRFTPASDREFERGLLAYVRLEYGGLSLDGITLRRTREGGLTLSWPARRDRRGEDHPIVRPLSDASRRDLEAAVIAELRRQGGAS